jgi:hypothetical protein
VIPLVSTSVSHIQRFCNNWSVYLLRHFDVCDHPSSLNVIELKCILKDIQNYILKSSRQIFQ